MNTFTSPSPTDESGTLTIQGYAAMVAYFDSLLIPIRYIAEEYMQVTDEHSQPTSLWSKSHEVLILHPDNVKCFDETLRQKGFKLVEVDEAWYRERDRIRMFQPIPLEVVCHE